MRRVFQALRIAVNDEFSSLDSFLRQLPSCLNPGGRVAILTFHSGEDRRVKKSFATGQRANLYSEIANEVIRPSAGGTERQPSFRFRETALGAPIGVDVKFALIHRARASSRRRCSNTTVVISRKFGDLRNCR